MVLLAILCDITGAIIMGSSNSLGQMLAGSSISGLGAGICELTALAGYVLRL